MKKITLLTLSALVLFGCNNNDGESETGSIGEKKSPKSLNVSDKTDFSVVSMESVRVEKEDSEAELTLSEGQVDIRSLGKLDGKDNDLIEHYNKKSDGAGEITTLIHTSPYNSLCNQVAVNTLYTVTPQPGLSVCLYFDIPADSRTDFFTLGQTSSRQTNTRIAHDILANSSLTLAGQGTGSGSEEHVLTYTEAGHYYMLIDSVATDGGAIQFGAAVNTQVDQYEDIGSLISYLGNDNPNFPFPITNDFDYYWGNMDNPNDVDNYVITSDNGQDIILSLSDDQAPGLWKFEVRVGSAGWIELAANQQFSLGVANAGQQMLFRARYNDGVIPDRTRSYRINAGSLIANIDNLTPGSTENINRMPYGTTNPYYTTQVHTNFEWKAKIEDSEGHPISNVLVAMVYATENIPNSIDSGVSDANGIVSRTITLPVFDKDEADHLSEHSYTEPGTGATQVWQTKYDAGAWYMLVPESRPEDEIGVGSQEGVQVQMAHMCKQKLITITDYEPCKVAICK